MPNNRPTSASEYLGIDREELSNAAEYLGLPPVDEESEEWAGFALDASAVDASPVEYFGGDDLHAESSAKTLGHGPIVAPLTSTNSEVTTTPASTPLDGSLLNLEA